MKARITGTTERKLLCHKLSEAHAAAVKSAAEAFGAETVFTEDSLTPVCTLLGENDSPAEEGFEPSDSECLLIAGFDRGSLGGFVDALRDSGVRIPLKAMYTPHNRKWCFSRLIAELEREHEYMTGGGKK